MNSNACQHRWWHGAVLYQLYVRSWLDTDGDGYGDLGGIIAGLDYLSWLGVDGVWLSPTMPSPDDDWGYDVSDYLGVHPDFGTMADMDALIAEAWRVRHAGRRTRPGTQPHQLGPSMVHRRGGQQGLRAPGFHVWAGPGPERRAAEQLAGRHRRPRLGMARADRAVLPAQLPGQPTGPELRESRVHEEFSEILRFWLDRGVAGFRIDVAHGLYKDAELRDNPPETTGNPLAGRFGQQQTYNANRPEVHQVYRDWRRIADGYPSARLLLGETWAFDSARLAASTGMMTSCNWPSISRLCSQPLPRLTCLPSSRGRWPSCRPGHVRCGWRRTMMWAGSQPGGAEGTSGRSGWPCWCSPPCRGPWCCITATRSG